MDLTKELKLIIPVGISGSGKSTWTKELINTNHNCIRLNRDDLRLQLVGDLKDYYQRRDLATLENMITEIQLYSLTCLLNKNKSVILDNTNLRINYFKPFIDTVENYNFLNPNNQYFIQFKFFDVSLKVAQNRVYRRDFLLKEIDKNEVIDNSHKEEVEYIEKQYNQYKHIKKLIIEKYPNYEIEN